MKGKPVRGSGWITAHLPYTGQVSLSLEPLCQCQEHASVSCWHRRRDLWSDCCLHRPWICAPRFSPHSSSLSSEVFGTPDHQAPMRLTWANWSPLSLSPLPVEISIASTPVHHLPLVYPLYESQNLVDIFLLVSFLLFFFVFMDIWLLQKIRPQVILLLFQVRWK